MRSSTRTLLALILLGLGAAVAGCRQDAPRAIDDLSEASYTLVNQDSTTVTFPDDFRGNVLVVGYIYTQCPDVCSRITANMKAVRTKLDDRDDVQFVTITFDPRRDTPQRLAAYRAAFGLDDTSWQFLTGTPSMIDAVMARMGVRHEIAEASEPSAPPDTTESYLINHTNQITLIDAQGRVRMHYGGSMTPPDILIEDINKIRT